MLPIRGMMGPMGVSRASAEAAETWETYVRDTIAPVFWLRLNEASGNPIDSGTAQPTLSISGATQAQTGQLGVGEAVEFDGVDDYIRALNDADIAGPSTWEYNVLIYPTGGESGFPRVFDWTGADFTVAINTSNGRLVNFISSTTTRFDTNTTSALTLNAWNLLSVTFDNSGDRRMHIFINGVEASYSAQPAMTGTYFGASNASLYIGNRSLQDTTLAGKIDEFIFTNYVLTADQRNQLVELAGL